MTTIDLISNALTDPLDYGYDTTIPTEGETLQSEWLMTMFGHYLVKLAVKVRLQILVFSEARSAFSFDHRINTWTT